MTRRSIDLKVPTDTEWVHTVLDQFDEFLADHANCERKASALAMSLVVKYPDRAPIIPTLIELAREELQHFQQVYALMVERGVALVADTPDPYVGALQKLMRSGREERFIDRLLISSVIECRGAERFGIIARALAEDGREPKLAEFYHELWAAETKHGHQFADMARKLYGDSIYPRLEELMEAESEIIATLPWRASLH
ncbi:MAG: tRNA-(ms[2]io[6]A)-hydroxylase [Pseudomonadota bacterium]